MLILLVGPKGSGKSHVGRVLARELGVRFFDIEPYWLQYREACFAERREPTIAEGIAAIHPQLRIALAEHAHVAVETTGASPEILADLLSVAPRERTLIVRIASPLDLCLERIARRDPTQQIPVDVATCRTIYEISVGIDLDADLVLDNAELKDDAIVARLASWLSTSPENT